jgi:hypothetical protein
MPDVGHHFFSCATILDVINSHGVTASGRKPGSRGTDPPAGAGDEHHAHVGPFFHLCCLFRNSALSLPRMSTGMGL